MIRSFGKFYTRRKYEQMEEKRVGETLSAGMEKRKRRRPSVPSPDASFDVTPMPTYFNGSPPPPLLFSVRPNVRSFTVAFSSPDYADDRKEEKEVRGTDRRRYVAKYCAGLDFHLGGEYYWERKELASFFSRKHKLRWKRVDR